jgi:hypothetical protein
MFVIAHSLVSGMYPKNAFHLFLCLIRRAMDFKRKESCMRFTFDIPTGDHTKLKMLSARIQKSMKDIILCEISKLVKDITMDDND